MNRQFRSLAPRRMDGAYLGFFSVLLLAVSSMLAPLQAAKVDVDPAEFGPVGGEQCISCHEKTSAGLATQWLESRHSKAGMNCLDCHRADIADNDAITHEGEVIATIVSPKDCGRCHTNEFQQQQGSVHANAASLIENRKQALANLGGQAMLGAGCDQCHGSVVKVRGDGSLDPETWPNSGIGRINPDGSRGSCSSCHGRHRFSKAQARDPGSCMRCHSGPDSPDMEVYQASKHGMHFAAERDSMNLDATPWRAGIDYASAPTCATCHMGAAGKMKPTHDVGMRSAWKLNSPVSEKQYLVVFENGEKLNMPVSQPAPKRGSSMTRIDGSLGKVKAVASPDRRRKAMSTVCLECHGKPFVTAFMKQFDRVVENYNEKFGEPARAIMQALYREKKLTPVAFDEPVELYYWELWHDEGAVARHGAAMASPNHAWWEGMYRVGRNFYHRFLPAVKQVAGDELAQQLIEEHVSSKESHQWLQRPQVPSPILGYGQGGE